MAVTAEEILAHAGHRPWPMPQRPWVMRQQWSRLLFAHWSVAPELLRPLVPPVLDLDVREGRCWVAVTPFYLSGLRGRGLPIVPGTSQFPELNVRTYVSIGGGKPGVYFFSLDAGSISAVFGARALYALPYFYARMRVRFGRDYVHYQCLRRHMGRSAEFEADYRPIGPTFQAASGSLDHFLTERYCLYAVQGKRVYRAEIHHVPWSLQSASASFVINTMAEAAGIELSDERPLLHYAADIKVLIWTPERLA